MNIILFDDNSHTNLLPLTYTRPVAELRVGILKISQKWEKYFNTTASFHTEQYLREKYNTLITDESLFINGGILPNLALVQEIKQLKKGNLLTQGKTLIAALLGSDEAAIFCPQKVKGEKIINTTTPYNKVNFPQDIFSLAGKEIEHDFKLLTKGRKSQPLSKTNQVLDPEHSFLEEGAKAEFAILNPAGGYIYLGKNSEIMEGAIVRGSLALCENSTLKLAAKIYGPTTIGPHSKVGGEVNNSVIFGYSNKGHDGFLGNSVLGEWCNIGADTNNSNLKNNYAEVKLWNYKQKRFLKTGLQFCGLIMGDHSKCGINTMFNTGTVVGVSSNIFGSGFPRNFVPSFAWGGAAGFSEYSLKKAFETAKLVMQRRAIEFDSCEQKILEHIFDLSSEFRNF